MEFEDRPDVSLILPAAGESTRMGGAIRKPFLQLANEPILHQTIKAFSELKEITEIILAVHPDDLETARDDDTLAALGITLCVAGGACRAETVWNAAQVTDPATELLAIHDAVRPFVTADLCRGLFSTAQRIGAAVPVIQVQDTLKQIDGELFTKTINRTGLVRVQTPQVFRRELYLEACEYALTTGGFSDRITDDASLIEAIDRPVGAIFGSPYNFKITSPDDLRLAEAWIKAK